MKTIYGLFLVTSLTSLAATIEVPGQKKSIQEAINAAAEGDTVLVARGTYHENISFRGKSVVLASHFLRSKNTRDRDETVIDGSRSGKKNGGTLIMIEKETREAAVIGFTLRNGNHAVAIHGRARIQHNHVTGNVDGLSFESGSGVIESNLIETNRDDGVDMDDASQAVITGNTIRNNRDDGIEIRMHAYTGAPLEIVIRGNAITGNGEDGIQLIDYPGRSDRNVRIERNVIANSAMVGIATMRDGNTKENYEGADSVEPVLVINNTIIGGQYGLTGGDNFVVMNNVFVGAGKAAIKRAHGDSLAGRNLFWKNGVDLEACDLNDDGFVRQDPMLDQDFRPGPKSPCRDAGTVELTGNGKKVLLEPGTYKGENPDLGAFESQP